MIFFFVKRNNELPATNNNNAPASPALARPTSANNVSAAVANANANASQSPPALVRMNSTPTPTSNANASTISTNNASSPALVRQQSANLGQLLLFIIYSCNCFIELFDPEGANAPSTPPTVVRQASLSNTATNPSLNNINNNATAPPAVPKPRAQTVTGNVRARL